MPTPLPIDDPQYFWSRAEEARSTAESMNDPECKRMMVDVGKTYEKLALRAEEWRGIKPAVAPDKRFARSTLKAAASPASCLRAASARVTYDTVPVVGGPARMRRDAAVRRSLVRRAGPGRHRSPGVGGRYGRARDRSGNDR
jgi:hypothetical protein